MEQINLKRDGDRDLSFTGKLIGKATSSPDRASGYYSGAPGHYQTLRLFLTLGGKLVAHQINHSQWAGEQEVHLAKVCVCNDDVIDFFGLSWVAKELYYDAGIDVSEKVDD